MKGYRENNNFFMNKGRWVEKRWDSVFKEMIKRGHLDPTMAEYLTEHGYSY